MPKMTLVYSTHFFDFIMIVNTLTINKSNSKKSKCGIQVVILRLTLCTRVFLQFKHGLIKDVTLSWVHCLIIFLNHENFVNCSSHNLHTLC